MQEPQAALLRGINVGGKHLVPMAELVKVFAGLGCTAIGTYIQSGNVVFTPPATALKESALAAAIERRFDFPVPIVLRSADDFARIVTTSPYPGVDARLLHVVFLAAPLTSEQLASLQALRVKGEEVTQQGSELHLYLPEGTGRSKLASGCINPRLPRTNTIRNWPTVLKLASMLALEP